MRAKHLAALLGFVLVQDLTGPSLGPALGLGARAQNPTVKVTRFENLPRNLFYFDDTATVLYHDSVEGNVYVSEDEGKSWNQAAGVPPNHALMLIEHPFENRMAFILGEKTTHWRTMNRGKTWQSFEMPLPVALTPAPLSFHADKTNAQWILFQVRECKKTNWGWTESCTGTTYYTLDAFTTEPKLLVHNSYKCIFAHSSSVRNIAGGKKKAAFAPNRPASQVFCVAFDKNAAEGSMNARASRLYTSADWFSKDIELIDFGLGQRASRGVTAVGIVAKFMVAALRDPASKSGELQLQVTLDGHTWHKAYFPHASSSKLLENAYTIVEGTSHSLGVDVLLHSDAAVGTLFVSNSNGTFFVQSLADTNRNRAGFVDFEELVGVEGVGIANYVKNARAVEGHKAAKQIRSVITFDDGRTWDPLNPPSDSDCRSSSRDTCALHLYSVSTPHNVGRVFSSPAPGLVLGVGSVGTHLRPYEQCDTYLSRDAGLTWKRIQAGAHMYEVGDQGSVMVLVDDEENTKQVKYSWDEGNTWKTLDLGVNLRARMLTTVPDSTSLKFILLGTLSREDQTSGGRHAVVHLDFEPVKGRKCESGDFEKWYARTVKGKECLMGHKQWYNRRKENANCYVGDKFNEAPEHEDNCPCAEEDYECDYNFIRQGKECVAAGPEPIPTDYCKSGTPGEKYMGSSGYRLIPGNTCNREQGLKKDDKVEKDCSQAQKPPGEVAHQTKFFKHQIAGNWYFPKAGTVLIQLDDGTVYQSSNEGYSWTQLMNGKRFAAVYMHSYAYDRAYLMTDRNQMYYTTDTARQWLPIELPAVPNQFGVGLLNFHPLQSDWLIYTGQQDCGTDESKCHAEAYYSLNHGRSWTLIEKYVRTCNWARTNDFKIDQYLILCESYRDKKGNQKSFAGNPLEFIEGGDYFKNKRKIFDNVVGFAKFSEYLLVAEVQSQSNSLDLQVSLDGRRFAMGKFPPGMSVNNHAYTVLESSTDSVFLHVTMSDKRGAEWGNVLKSNSNGTYYGLSLGAVNRNAQGYVDFEKMAGLDGIVVMNIVANPQEAEHTGKKKIQTRISHNDGGTWKPMTPPLKDSLGQNYACTGTKCALHIHGYTERYDARAKYSSPSAIGLMMGVGSVSEHLAPYKDSDTFLTRDGGFTWEEVHKDAHLFEYGDSGSIIVIVNDEEPTDHVLYTTNEGISWREYKFSDEKYRIRSIVTKPTDTSRKFILLGHKANSRDSSVAVHVDFSAISSRQCVLDPDNPSRDDFELWSPSEEREERCLFGRQVLYHRRLRDRDCYVGDQVKIEKRMVKNCACMASDFECEFNYVRNNAGECVLTPGAEPLPNDDTCPGDDTVWYERTPYRKIPHSTCEGGNRIDRGPEHPCPGIGSHGFLFWAFVVMLPIAFAGLVGLYFKKHGFATGAIRLPDHGGQRSWNDSGIVSTLASIPVAIVAASRELWARVSTLLPNRRGPRYPTRGGYRTVAVDEDAQVLRFEDDD